MRATPTQPTHSHSQCPSHWLWHAHFLSHFSLLRMKWAVDWCDFKAKL